MLGQWRVVLKQAEEAARAGRYDEALALAGRPDVVDHQQAVRLRGRMAMDLIARGVRRGEADDLAGALGDLGLAERLAAPPDALAAARLSLADRAAREARADLEAGDPGRVIDRVEELGRLKVGGPALRRLGEAAEAWATAESDARRGEFGRAHENLDRAERLAQGSAADPLAAARRQVESRRNDAAPRVEALYAALEQKQWARVLAAAESVLDLIPEHPAARQARTQAWQRIAAIGPGSMAWPDRGGRVAQQTPDPGGRTISDQPRPQAPQAAEAPDQNPGANGAARPLSKASSASPGGRFLLWLDAVGGYLVCLDDEVVLGRAGPDSTADIPLLGDLSRDHARIVRDGEGYILRPNRSCHLNGKAVDGPAPLRHGDVIRLGSTVELEFHQPSPASATARLEIVSRHRLPLAVDGVLLMAETCIIGPGPQSHIQSIELEKPVVLYRQGGALWCRAPGAFDVDGRASSARAPLTLKSSVLGDGFSFSLEPLAHRPAPGLA
ncbi:FHA domain-containing protein [Isosphaeraceae bacterium EP7]